MEQNKIDSSQIIGFLFLIAAFIALLMFQPQIEEPSENSEIDNESNTTIQKAQVPDDSFTYDNTNIQVLENIRFFEGEKENSQELGNKLGSLGDIYVFDAFGTAHREQASTHAAIMNAPIACSGLLLEKEENFLSQALKKYERPYVAIIGGAKVSTKLELIKHINEVADHIIVGGGIANTFIKSSGLNVGNSLTEESMLEIAKSILDKGKVILPNRVLTSKTFEGEDIKETSISNIGNDEMILDLYLEQETKTLINNAKTILWNGPMGVFENSLFEKLKGFKVFRSSEFSSNSLTILLFFVLYKEYKGGVFSSEYECM